MAKVDGAKGLDFEEVLRGYFLRANFYVLRSLPLRMLGEDLTDIDIWLYERPAGFARRRAIVDAKFKSKPKAAERLFWTKGVSEMLKVDGAYVATTDTRPIVRLIAHQIGLAVLDGTDISRIAASTKIGMPERLSGEELNELIRRIDSHRLSRSWTDQLDDAKASLLEACGVPSANRALAAMAFFATEAVTAHPNSEPAATAVRATFLSASMAAVSLDFVAAEASFRPADERRRMLLNGLRFGNADRVAATEKLRLALALVEQLSDGGAAVARQIENRFEDEVAKIPAEIIADQVVKISQRDTLFAIARELEAAAHDRDLRGFDHLSSDAKGMVASFLDFHGLSRTRFAEAFTRDLPDVSSEHGGGTPSAPDGSRELGPTHPTSDARADHLPSASKGRRDRYKRLL